PRASDGLQDYVHIEAAGRPVMDFAAPDGVRHSSWAIGQAGEIDFIARAFAGIPSLYIADGHHRSAAAARAFQARKGAGRSAWFLSVIFPHTHVQILPYNRVVRDLNGQSPEALLKKLETIFTINPAGS